MTRLQGLAKGAAIRGIIPEGLVTIVDVRWYGTAAVELTYKDAPGRPGNQLLYRDDERRLELVTAGRPATGRCVCGLRMARRRERALTNRSRRCSQKP